MESFSTDSSLSEQSASWASPSQLWFIAGLFWFALIFFASFSLTSQISITGEKPCVASHNMTQQQTSRTATDDSLVASKFAGWTWEATGAQAQQEWFTAAVKDPPKGGLPMATGSVLCS